MSARRPRSGGGHTSAPDSLDGGLLHAEDRALGYLVDGRAVLRELRQQRQAVRLARRLSPQCVDEPWTGFHEPPSGIALPERDSGYGRYWARTSDPQLVELVLSQLS